MDDGNSSKQKEVSPGQLVAGVRSFFGLVAGFFLTIARWVIIGAQWLIVLMVNALIWVRELKLQNPNRFRTYIKPGIALIASVLLVTIGLEPGQRPTWWNPYWISYPLAYKAISGCITGAISVLILGALVPLLLYVPSAVSLRAMGLIEARADRNRHADSMSKALNRYLKFHDDRERIRVICISGKDLFVRYSGEDNFAPLHSFAKVGKLDVLLPASDEKSTTILERYKTYSLDFKKSAYPKITDLITEIEASKNFLRLHQNNVTEHSAICMWRVVLTSRHCIVQNYFPNRTGCHSNTSPVFVFSNEESAAFSYYSTFDYMFTLLTKKEV